jgi:2-methylcitrate dehydratase PrpD
MELVHDAELDAIYPTHYPGWVEIETRPGGGVFERVYRDDPSGSIANPNKEAAMIEKFHRLLADLGLGGQAKRIESLALGLEGVRARDLVASLHLPARAAAE